MRMLRNDVIYDFKLIRRSVVPIIRYTPICTFTVTIKQNIN